MHDVQYINSYPQNIGEIQGQIVDVLMGVKSNGSLQFHPNLKVFHTSKWACGAHSMQSYDNIVSLQGAALLSGGLCSNTQMPLTGCNNGT